MKTVKTVLTWAEIIIGFFILLGPSAWNGVQRSATIALAVTLAFVGGFWIVVLWKIISNQIRPPYANYDNERLGG